MTHILDTLLRGRGANFKIVHTENVFQCVCVCLIRVARSLAIYDKLIIALSLLIYISKLFIITFMKFLIKYRGTLPRHTLPTC